MVGKNENEGVGSKPLDMFLKIGLDERIAKNTVAYTKADVTDGCDWRVGNLLYTEATNHPANALDHRPTLVKYLVSSKIKTPAQLEAAFSFLAEIASDKLSIDDFEAACGVGVEVSLGDVEKAVNEIFEENKAIILEQRYRTNVGELFGHVRKKQPWAYPKIAEEKEQLLMRNLRKRKKSPLSKLRLLMRYRNTEKRRLTAPGGTVLLKNL